MNRHRVAAELKVVLAFSVVLTIFACLSQPSCAQDPRTEFGEVREPIVPRLEAREMSVQQMAPEHRIQKAATRAFVVQEDARLNVEQQVQGLDKVDPDSANAVREIVKGLSQEQIHPEELERLRREADRLPPGPEIDEGRESLDPAFQIAETRESLNAAFQIAEMKILVDELSNAGKELVDRRNELTQQRAGVTGGLAVSLLTYGMTFFGFLSKQSHSKLERQLMQLQIKEKRAELEGKGIDLSSLQG